MPEVIGMQTYTMLVEQIERFEDTLWPVLREERDRAGEFSREVMSG